MKKKIFLMLSMAILLVCIFAISISAETVISENNIDENGDIVADVLLDLGNNRYIVSVDIFYTDANGQVKDGKFYYETSYWDARNMRQVKTVYVPSDFDFSQMIYIFDKADYDGNNNYASNELTKLNEGGGGFKMYSYTSYENGTFTDTADIITSIQRVSYSKYFVKFADGGFGAKAPKLTTITYNGREPIEGALIVSPLIDEIFGGSFGGHGSNLTSNSIVTPFTKLIFEDREISVSFGQYCFTRNIIEEIYFGKGTYNLGNKERIALLFGNDYANGEGATLKTVILHKEAKISSGEISWNVGSYDVVVLGKESECKEFYEANHQSKLPCAKSVTYNPCYYGHTEGEDDDNCTTALSCTVCGTALEKAYDEHDAQITIEYNGGYSSAGCKNVSCSRCGYTSSEEAPALFTCLGYSAKIGGTKITVGYSVDQASVEAYETSAGKTLKYGVVAYVPDATDNDADNTPINNDLTLKNPERTIFAEVEANTYAGFNFILNGFDEESYGLELIMSAFVYDGSKVYYLGANGQSEVGELITFNDKITQE